MLVSDFARDKARGHGVTGWCRNTDDNKVGARGLLLLPDASMACSLMNLRATRSRARRRATTKLSLNS